MHKYTLYKKWKEVQEMRVRDLLFITYSFVLFGLFLSACITKSSNNNNNYYIVATIKKTRKNEQIGLNMDSPYWVNITENYSCSIERLTDPLVGMKME